MTGAGAQAGPGDGAAAALRPLIDGRAPTPLYHQVYLVLRDRILTGGYGHGTVLPGEQDLGEMFGVSRITTKRALNELAEEGFVERARGRGTRVTYRAEAAPVEASVEGLLENLLAMGLETEVELREFGYVAPDREVRALLGLDTEGDVQRAVRVRRLNGAPFSHLTTWVPGDIGRSWAREDLASRPLLALLERSGVAVGRAEQTIAATAADAAVARALDTGIGAPLLAIRRVVFDKGDRPVELISALYRPDRYQFRMTLSRVGDGAARAWSMTDGE